SFTQYFRHTDTDIATMIGRWLKSDWSFVDHHPHIRGQRDAINNLSSATACSCYGAAPDLLGHVTKLCTPSWRMLPSVIGSPGGCLGPIASPPASQALIPAREPSPRALSVGRFREPGPACGRSGRWHAIAARGEVAIRATAAPVRDRQRLGR